MQHSPRLKTVGTWVLGSTVYSYPCSYTSCYLWLWGGGQHSRFSLCRANSSNSCRLMVSTGGVLYSCSRVGYSALSTRLLFCENSIARQFSSRQICGKVTFLGNPLSPLRPCTWHPSSSWPCQSFLSWRTTWSCEQLAVRLLNMYQCGWWDRQDAIYQVSKTSAEEQGW